MKREEIKDYIELYKRYQSKRKEISKEYFLDRTDWLNANKFKGNKFKIVKYLKELQDNNRGYLIDELIIFINAANYTFYKDLEMILENISGDICNFMYQESEGIVTGNVFYYDLLVKYSNNRNFIAIIEDLKGYFNPKDIKECKLDEKILKFISFLISYSIYTNIINTNYDDFLRLYKEIMDNQDNELFISKFELSDVNIASPKDCSEYFTWYFSNNTNKILKKDML